MPRGTGVPLVRIGRYGRATHALEPNGRALCDHASTPFLTRDADGGYQDATLRSATHPTGTTGRPSCVRCAEMLNV
jgi:hypothetical protein